MNEPQKLSKDDVLNALLGLCVGDALGVPVEFLSRERLRQSPVTDMIGWGTHNQRSGTWSDDSSMAFCLADSLCEGYNLDDIARKFVGWYRDGLWTPYGNVFDIGIATSSALHKVAKGKNPLLSGGYGEEDNGNGSLMRTLPLVFYIRNLPIAERYRAVAEVSSITHAHIRSVFACFFYCEYALELLNRTEKQEALRLTQNRVNAFAEEFKVLDSDEQNLFQRILGLQHGPYADQPLPLLLEEQIASSGYVLHTLEASLWCLLTTDTYAQAVLKAVNLGKDTDTTGCVTGGLAGMYYGWQTIPESWTNLIARREDIVDLADRLYLAYSGTTR
ncbi:MAG: ADP-ribosylglycohydrolase family protein [Cytophagales bacterium]|nr:MAG: ADP-ribosylglycohydrolase family protein [Cytophagales bacterium]